MEYLVGIVIVLAVALAIGLFANRRKPKVSYTTGWQPYPRPAGSPAPMPPTGGSAVQPPVRQQHIHIYQPPTRSMAGYAPASAPSYVQDDDVVVGAVAGQMVGQALVDLAEDLSQPASQQPDDFQAGGAVVGFGGGGSQASWDPTPDPSPEPERYEAPAPEPDRYDPPSSNDSYDSGSSGGGYDSGSSDN